jgi:hypothetical protein
MENKKTFEGVLAEVWKPGKVLKIIVKATEEELENLLFALNKKVKIILDDGPVN